ncbi:MAG: prepilin-type N-terminal cleavage/methylation domain-containing protein [Tepidisphaeraceae bacterium]
MARVRRHVQPKTAPGFTLIEAAVAVAVIAVGSMAVMQLSYACTKQNAYSGQITTASMLATHIREMLQPLSFNDPSTGTATFGAESGETLSGYDDVDDFNGQTFSPPIDVNRQTISGMPGYSQRVTVRPVSTAKLSGNLTGTEISNSTYTGAVRITVDILYTEPGSNRTGTAYTMSWIKVAE